MWESQLLWNEQTVLVKPVVDTQNALYLTFRNFNGKNCISHCGFSKEQILTICRGLYPFCILVNLGNKVFLFLVNIEVNLHKGPIFCHHYDRRLVSR